VTDSGNSGSQVDLPSDVKDALEQQAAAKGADPKPRWADKFVWSSLWKVVAVVVAVFVLAVVAFRAQHLIRLLIISVFLALAIVPAVNAMQRNWGWKRGAAVGVIYAGLIGFMVLMIVILIPGIVEFAQRVGSEGGDWAADLNDFTESVFGFTAIGDTSGAAINTETVVEEWGDDILGLASQGFGLVFDLATIALFTFYFAADYSRIDRAIMSRMPAQRQRIYGWVADTALEQTGGYFYSRILLMVINGVLTFGAMVLIGMPVAFALPLAVFESFFATFIPAVGTYIGAAVPILIALALLGLPAALILLVFVLVYQQIENYWLSPKLSAETMELNGGVAFGAALAGGAIAGPAGAFMALPVAALITAVITNVGQTYDVVYQSRFDTDVNDAAAASAEVDGG